MMINRYFRQIIKRIRREKNVIAALLLTLSLSTACGVAATGNEAKKIEEIISEDVKTETNQAENLKSPKEVVDKFYRWYLKEKSSNLEKFKTGVSAKLSQRISKMNKNIPYEFFTRIPPNKKYSEVWVLETKLLKHEENSALVEVELIGEEKHATTHLVPIHVSLIKENDVWKIDSVEKGDYEKEVSQ